MKKEKIKTSRLLFLIVMFAVSLAAIEIHSCKKTDENKSLHVFFSQAIVPRWSFFPNK